MQLDKSCDTKLSQKVFLLHLGQAAACCRSTPIDLETSRNIEFYLEHWEQEHQQLQQGVEIGSCEYCWKKERLGLISERQKQQERDKVIEIYFNNVCNHMCSYCSPKFSSVWQESIDKHGTFVNVSKSVKNNQIFTKDTLTSTDHWIEQLSKYISHQEDNSVALRLLGGEPLMQKKSLQKFLKLTSKKVKKIIITTNLNPPSNRFLSWILDAFPLEKLQFNVSLDATVEYNSIPRAGFDPKRFETNLALLQKKQVEFSFASVVSVLSVFDINNFCQWLDKNQFNTIFSRINNPDCLSLDCVPMTFKQKILNTLHNLPESVKIIMHNPQEPTLLKLFEQYHYLKQYFARTNIDPTKISNPLWTEYWHWLNDLQKQKIS